MQGRSLIAIGLAMTMWGCKPKCCETPATQDPPPRPIYAETSVKCSSQVHYISTGTSAGSCVVNYDQQTGQATGGRCDDGGHNTATVDCRVNGGKGGCTTTMGAGTCTTR